MKRVAGVLWFAVLVVGMTVRWLALLLAAGVVLTAAFFAVDWFFG